MRRVAVLLVCGACGRFGFAATADGASSPDAPPGLGDAVTDAPDAGAGATGDIVDVSAGYYQTCVARATGTAWCWGYGGGGSIGDGATLDRATPVQVMGLTNIVQTAVGTETGGFNSACARDSAGGGWCWGDNQSGELGDGTTTSTVVPVQVASLAAAVDICVGALHACARRTDTAGGGSIDCWGGNSFGQLGIGNNVNKSKPTSVQALHAEVDVACGGYHTCAALTAGGAACWGNNNTGQLGDGTTTDTNSPTAVMGLPAVALQVSGSGPNTALLQGHSCALLVNGQVACWGDNTYGQLGDGTTVQRTTAVTVVGISTAVEVAAGGIETHGHTCARLASGQVACWGENASGQLGDGTTTNSPTPVMVMGLTDAVQLAAGDSHVCARRTTGALVCWGSNFHGALGNGTGSDSATPVLVAFP